MTGAMENQRLSGELADAEPRTQLKAIAKIAAAPGDRLPEEALAALVRCTGASAKPVQLRAADALAEIAHEGDERAASMLRAALSDSSRRMRWGAAYALSRIGGGAFALDAANAIAEALGDSDSDIRWAAAGLFAQLCLRYPDEIRTRLIELTGAGDRNARRMAFYCIRDMGCCGADIVAAIKRALGDDDRFVRLAAIAALARMEDTAGEAAGILAERAESDPDTGVRGAAKSSLARLLNR
jgi:HEAT repeat protein